MPAKSRAQQRLMGAAEHGAQFPMARKIRASMTHQQMHDFATGSEAGKPEHVPKKRTLHPALAARAVAVKAAHAHLTRTMPGFRNITPAEQFAHTQRHVRKLRG